MICTAHVFLFKHELIFPVKLKAITIYRHCLVKDQNCWESVSLWEALTDSSLNAVKLVLQFRWVDMSWTLLKSLSVLNYNRNGTREILSRVVGLLSLSIYSVIWLFLQTICWLTYTHVLLSSVFLLVLFQAAIIIHFVPQNLGFSSHYNKSKTKRKSFQLLSLPKSWKNDT